MNNAILLLSEATQTALIVGGFGFAGIVVTSVVQIILASRRSEKVQAVVGTLAENIDGAMTELKETIAAKSSAEGQLKGITAEQPQNRSEWLS